MALMRVIINLAISFIRDVIKLYVKKHFAMYLDAIYVLIAHYALNYKVYTIDSLDKMN